MRTTLNVSGIIPQNLVITTSKRKTYGGQASMPTTKLRRIIEGIARQHPEKVELERTMINLGSRVTTSRLMYLLKQ